MGRVASETHSRLALATEQLEDAIRLHLDGRYASATTLAGAAEEVFGRQAERTGQSSVMQERFRLVSFIQKFFPTHVLYKTFSDYAAKENATRNNLKHLREGVSEILDADLELEAAKMILRALENAERIGVKVCGFEDFSAWFHEHIVGL